ncbi:kinase-like domain-containing protein [Chaetomium tenue]|uniref:Kinase-like domain-containing protein n=1 Tax=Chaetomium tenue TaxID=1854479 RepID=A0ACB7PA65_9PEZI|nr:kinase-like domain-containing protein [Chaetomium globosum]
MSDRINFPTGFGMKDLVACGSTGMILLDKSTDTVIKSPHDDESTDALAIEQHIYERFVQRGGHKAILCYHGPFESGIRLEYAPRGNIRSYLEDHPADGKRRTLWAVQLAEALDFIHKCGVIHGDVNGFNVLLDRNLDVKLADFAGSSLDGSPLLVGVTASHEYPGPLLSVEADIFALDSTLYELLNESRPYAGLTDTVIFDHYSKGKFPDTNSLGSVGSIIRKCWRGEFKECSQAVSDLKAERQRLHISTSHNGSPTKHTSIYAIILVAAATVVAASVLMKLKSRSR